MVEEPPITKSNKTSYESLFGLFLIGCAPVLLLRHSLFSPEIFYYRDFWQLVYPNLKWGLSTLNTGHFPLWNPYIASGFPIFAGMLHGFAYPPLFLLLPFFPSSFEITLKFFILFHFLWAGAGLYLLCRYWKLAPLPSALGGLIFMLSGPFISGLNNLAYLVSPSWIPWALLCYAKSHENRNWLPVTAIVMALMALSGEIQTCYNTGLIFVLFSLCHFKKSIPLYSQYFTSFKNLSIIVILALLLAAIQIFPSFELAAHSERLTGASEEDSLFFSLYLEDLVRFFVPYIYGNPTDIWYGRAEIWPGRTVYHHAPFESSIYIGLLTLPLCLAGCFSKKVRNSKYFLISGFLFFFLTSFGAEIPFYTFLRDIHLPLWSSFRYSEKLILPAIFFASLLAAFGLEQLLSLSGKRKLIFTIATSILLLLILIGLFSKIPAFGSTDPHLNRVAAEYRSTQFLSSFFFLSSWNTRTTSAQS